MNELLTQALILIAICSVMLIGIGAVIGMVAISIIQRRAVRKAQEQFEQIASDEQAQTTVYPVPFLKSRSYDPAEYVFGKGERWKV